MTPAQGGAGGIPPVPRIAHPAPDGERAYHGMPWERCVAPFFEGRGCRVVKAQQVERRGVLLPNFVMEKLRDSI